MDCAACKVVIDSGVAAMAETTAALVENGQLQEPTIQELIELDKFYIEACTGILGKGLTLRDLMAAKLT